MVNAITIDLEDWAQAVIDPGLPITECVVRNTERVLALLDSAGVKATFFALGRVCEAFPTLLPRIADAGHEIGSHGYGHELIYRQTPETFAEDVRRSIEIIGEQVGRAPAGYRAPAFSITQRSRWAGPILADAGFRYSSSIFPINGRRYGIPDAPRGPHRWADCELIEVPPATVRVLGRNLPACGGGYTRLLPGALLERAIRRMNAEGLPAVLYLHPYELAPGEVRSFRLRGVSVSWRRHLTQELWRTRVERRLLRRLRALEFGPVSLMLRETGLCAEPAETMRLPHSEDAGMVAH